MKKQRNIMILFFTMVVANLGFGMVLPILPFYVESFGATATQLGLLMAIYSIAQFIFSPIFGELSDRYGRKRILILGILGNALSQLLFALSTQLWMLYAARALAGILASATMPTAMAYISDSTDENERGGGMGILGAAVGVGMVLGPGIGGWLGSVSLSTPFFFAAGLSLLAAVFVLAVLPESMPREQSLEQTRTDPVFQIQKMWQALVGSTGYLFLLAFLVSFGLTSFEGVFGLYVEHFFGFGPAQVGTILTVVGLLSAVMLGVLTGPLTRRWGEVMLIKLSLIGSALGFGVMLLAFDFPTVLLTVGVFMVCNTLLRPSISSLTSKQVAGGQGAAMGLNNSFMSLGRIIGPLWAGMLFDVNFSLPYISAGVIMLVTFLLSLRWLKSAAPNEGRKVEVVNQPAGD